MWSDANKLIDWLIVTYLLTYLSCSGVTCLHTSWLYYTIILVLYE